MTDKKEQSLVFEYEPQSIAVTLLKLLIIAALIGGAFYGGYMYRLEQLKPELARIKGLEDEAAGLREKTAQAEKLANKLAEENKQLAAGNEGFVKMRDSLNGQITALKKENGELKKAAEQRDALLKENTALKKETAEQKELLARNAEEIKKLNNIRDDNIAKLEELTKEINARRTQVETLEKDKRELKVEQDKALRRVDYYKKQYEKIIAKYDEIRDEYLEANPDQNAITWMESQLFEHPEGKYKILLEISQQQGNYLDFELGVYSKRKFFPKFTISFYNEKGEKLDKTINVDETVGGYGAGRIVFLNQGWRADKDNLPKYLKIDYLK